MGHGPSSNPPTTMAVCFRTHSRHNGPGVNTRNPDIMALCNHSGSPDLKERRTKMTTNFTQMWMDVYFNQRWKWNGHFAVYFFKIHQNAKRNESFNESGCIDWELFVFITQTLLTMKQWQLSSFLNRRFYGSKIDWKYYGAIDQNNHLKKHVDDCEHEAQPQNAGSAVATKMSSFWQNVHHWLHRKLSKWQLPVQPMMKIPSEWQLFLLSV